MVLLHAVLLVLSGEGEKQVCADRKWGCAGGSDSIVVLEGSIVLCECLCVFVPNLRNGKC